MSRNKKLLVIFLCVLLFGVVPACVSFVLFFPKFQVNEFVETEQVQYNAPMEYHAGEVCYGNVFGCSDVQVEREGEVNTSSLGCYQVTYVYSYQGKEFELKQVVEVVDTTPPVLTVQEEEIAYCPNGSVPNVTVSAMDNYDGDITDKVEKRFEGEEIIFESTDSVGNTSIVRKKAVQKDEEGPVLTLNGDESIYVLLHERYVEEGAKATDNCDGDLTSEITISGEVNTDKEGEYTLTYSVKDKSGNESSKTRKVYVYQKNVDVTPNGKSIYLTFDDGPSKYTSELLGVLKKYNVKATFFVTDQNLTKGYDSVIKRAYDEGHSIGLHTSSHSYSIYSSVDTYFNDLYAIQDKVKRITGYTSMLIRFPGGSSNTISKNYDYGARIMSQLSKEVERRGFKYVDWNVVSGDAGETTNTAEVVSNVINSLGNKSTYVVLQHDIKDFSVDAVESIIQFGLAHGYTFRAYTMSSPTVHHSINN